MQQELAPYFNTTDEDCYYSILPTTTQYARNSIFSGLSPLELKNTHYNYWVSEIDEGGKNKYEDELLTSEVFVPQYRYHKISLVGDYWSSQKTIDALVAYLNDNPVLIKQNTLLKESLATFLIVKKYFLYLQCLLTK